MSQALLDLFPNIGLDKARFISKSILLIINWLIVLLIRQFEDAWHEEDNRRKFFEDYAAKNGFDPLDPNEWYKQSIDKLTATKVFNFFCKNTMIHNINWLIYYRELLV